MFVHRLKMRIAAGAALVVTVSGCSMHPTQGHIPGDAKSCAPAPSELSYAMPVLNTLRIYTGEDGVSHAEKLVKPAQESTYLGALLRQYPLGDPSNVVIASGPPNFKIPRHPAPYREIFVLLSGSSVIELSDGTAERLHAGSVVFVEDTTGPGHGGTFGPCGYVAMDMQFKSQPALAH